MISNETVKHIFSGDGSSKTFQIPFDFFKNTAGVFDKNNQIAVILTSAAGIETTLTEDVDYAVETNNQTESGNSENDPSSIGSSGYSGYIVMNTAPAVGEKLTIMRDVPLVQELDLVPGQEIGQIDLEAALDKVVMMHQQLNEKISRAISYKPSSTNMQMDADAYIAALQESETRALQSASNASASAQEAMQQAEAATDEADRAATHAQSAESAKTAAQSANESAQEAATNAQEAAQQAAEEVLSELTKYKKQIFNFTSGTPSGDYDGSLTTFNTGLDLANMSVVPFLNGQRKDESEYSISGAAVVFNFNTRAGDRVVLEVNSMARLFKQVEADEVLAQHNADSAAHPALEARVAALEESGGSGGGEEWRTWSGGNYYTAEQLRNGLSYGDSSAGSLGIYANKTITKFEAWAGNGTEGNPYIKLPWTYGWHIKDGFLHLYYLRPGMDFNFSKYYTNANAINVVVRVYYK